MAGISDCGILIDYRTYNCAELAPYRRLASGLTAGSGRWEVHYDPYDLTRVWVRNHHHGGWITVPWTHLPMVARRSPTSPGGTPGKIAAQRGVDDASETAVAVVLAELLRRAGQGPDTRGRWPAPGSAALPGLRAALPAPEPADGPGGRTRSPAGPGTSGRRRRAGTVAGFGLFDPFGRGGR